MVTGTFSKTEREKKNGTKMGKKNWTKMGKKKCWRLQEKNQAENDNIVLKQIVHLGFALN